MANGDTRRLRWDGTVHAGTLLQILALTATLVAAYFGVRGQLEEMKAQQQQILQRITAVEGQAFDAARRNQRIELYLSKKDVRYWQVIAEFERAMPKEKERREP